MEIELSFPDGKKVKVNKGSRLSEMAPKDAVVARLGEKLVDLATAPAQDSVVEFLSVRTPEGVDVMRHSCAHILADAVLRLFPSAKPTIGPVIDKGFYYDFDFERAFTPEDLKAIEGEMNRIIAKNEPFERAELSKAEALKEFQDNKYKIELVEEYGDGVLSIYKSGVFTDLCRGPHVPSSGHLKSFKLTKAAGAYWRGDAKNPQLQRIYGIAFVSQQDLKEYLVFLEEAEKRDHRKLGRELELFSIHEEGPGFIFFLPKGMIIWNELLDFWREEHTKAGYLEIKTPIILSKTLWERSGHWSYYKENMYTLKIDDQDFAIKPMNCPGGMMVYNEKAHSYREFPLRVGEIGLVHRHEMSGVLSGLFRVRCFHQDDAHIYMTEEQAKDEVLNVLNLAEKFYTLFGLSYHLEISTRPAKSVGTDEQWAKSEKMLIEALDSTGKQYKINPGDGAFYGPKIDIHIKDCIGRTWQCGTIQLDMNLPERFDLTYIGEDNAKHRPVMVHRVIYGSVERFFGILIEHYAGKFPLWLSPEQVRVLTIADRFIPYAEGLIEKFKAAGIRATSDFKSESVSKKVREAQLAQVNYMLVIGEQEVATGTVNVRTRDNKVLGQKSPDDFMKELVEEIKERR